MCSDLHACIHTDVSTHNIHKFKNKNPNGLFDRSEGNRWREQLHGRKGAEKDPETPTYGKASIRRRTAACAHSTTCEELRPVRDEARFGSQFLAQVDRTHCLPVLGFRVCRRKGLWSPLSNCSSSSLPSGVSPVSVWDLRDLDDKMHMRKLQVWVIS